VLDKEAKLKADEDKKRAAQAEKEDEIAF